MYYYFFGSVAATIVVWALGSYIVVKNIEEPSYQVLEERAGYEVRQYEAYIIAEVDVSGSYREALSQGFRLIADYIFGNNTTKTSIAMTAPVLEQSSEKIAMTVPVINTREADASRTVSFVLPSKYTIETLPLPNNSEVRLVEVPGKKVAALRFNWYATESRVAAKKSVLENKLTKAGIATAGPTQVAQYNPPLSFPLTRRDEILIPIE